MLAMVVAVVPVIGLASIWPAQVAVAYAPFKVLVFSKTTEFRHTTAIAAGIQAVRDLGAANSFTVDATENDALTALSWSVPHLTNTLNEKGRERCCQGGAFVGRMSA
jgi:hypothetical protein